MTSNTITEADLASLDFCTRGAAKLLVFCTRGAAKLLVELNNDGEGFAVGGGISDGDIEADEEAVSKLDINDIDGLGARVWAAQNDGQVAIYRNGDKVTLVGDFGGPWAVEVRVVD